MDLIKCGFILLSLTFVTSVSQSDMRLSLEAQGLSFTSEDYGNSSLKNFGFLGASLKSDAQKKDLVITDLTALYAMGHPALSYLNLREIYFSYSIDEDSKLFVGRKLNNWSQLDTDWNIGLFNPQFRWNSLLPEAQGMTGIFWERSKEYWRLGLFASPIFIPDQGPSYEIKDGQFTDVNPWFPNPPQSVRFNGSTLLPIDYDVKKPEVNEVVFQTLYGAQVQLGEKQGFFANFSGIYKPANQLALGYKKQAIVNRVRVELLPKVYNENNVAVDFGYRALWGQSVFSLLYSKPTSPSFASGYNVPEFEESLSFGPRFVLNLRPFQISLSYLDTSGGNVKEIGPDASADRAALSQRFLYRQSYEGKISYSEIFLKKVKVETSLQYRQSQKDEFKQIHFKQKIDIRGPWAFWADVLLIDTAELSTSNMEAYRNLDQVLFGVRYDM